MLCLPCCKPLLIARESKQRTLIKHSKNLSSVSTETKLNNNKKVISSCAMCTQKINIVVVSTHKCEDGEKVFNVCLLKYLPRTLKQLSKMDGEIDDGGL